ncbi:DUF5060 domain-containing protein [Mariniflexile gromovii]|uniref:DUF5060 domain-containing protein n=1 Tax=Mariniflexile gromovii TaxID=362523 RepID=A0ABS4BTB2_9FLAO|nr:DUF5060 domain-containing protein [Mariniflexile gromovii]MBP0903830.1 DUF5060 domain-containing protein [Mariniflexile gromovii]
MKKKMMNLNYRKVLKTKLILTAMLSWLVNSSFAANVSGELKLWHKITVNYTSQNSYSETGKINPYTDCRLDVIFTNGQKSYTVSGYFAADGDAANTGATSGNIWKIHFTPNEIGNWSYSGKFYSGKNVAASNNPTHPIEIFNGSFNVENTDKLGRDFRGKGILQYKGERYPLFDNGSRFIKAGPGDPENLLSIADFDNTPNAKHTYLEHEKDWKKGDPIWNGNKGKSIIGLMNYLADQGCNTQYFLLWTGGDDKMVWPWINPTDYLHYDVSKLEQWEILFSHMTKLGIHLHLFFHEEEIDMIMNSGNLGLETRIYFREMIARFGHHNALTWNMGEEINRGLDFQGGKDPSTKQIKSWADYISKLDCYNHPIGVHTYPPKTQNLYQPLLGHKTFHAATLQTSDTLDNINKQVKEWIDKSKKSKHPWLVSNDEQGGAATGIDPNEERMTEYRKKVLWGTLMAGGWGVEYYFGREGFTVNNFRKYEQAWREAGNAIRFFEDYVPFWEMESANNLVSHGLCLANPGDAYVIYLENGGSTYLDVGSNKISLEVKWFNPRTAGKLQNGSLIKLEGTGKLIVGDPPSEQLEDWVVIIKKF